MACFDVIPDEVQFMIIEALPDLLSVHSFMRTSAVTKNLFDAYPEAIWNAVHRCMSRAEQIETPPHARVPFRDHDLQLSIQKSVCQTLTVKHCEGKLKLGKGLNDYPEFRVRQRRDFWYVDFVRSDSSGTEQVLTPYDKLSTFSRTYQQVKKIAEWVYQHHQDADKHAYSGECEPMTFELVHYTVCLLVHYVAAAEQYTVRVADTEPEHWRRVANREKGSVCMSNWIDTLPGQQCKVMGAVLNILETGFARLFRHKIKAEKGSLLDLLFGRVDPVKYWTKYLKIKARQGWQEYTSRRHHVIRTEGSTNNMHAGAECFSEWGVLTPEDEIMNDQEFFGVSKPWLDGFEAAYKTLDT